MHLAFALCNMETPPAWRIGLGHSPWTAPGDFSIRKEKATLVCSSSSTGLLQLLRLSICPTCCCDLLVAKTDLTSRLKPKLSTLNWLWHLTTRKKKCGSLVLIVVQQISLENDSNRCKRQAKKDPSPKDNQAHSTVMNETPWMNWLILKPTMLSHHESGGLTYQTYQTSTHQHHIHRHGIKSMMSCNFAKKKHDGIPGSNWATFQYPTLYLHPAPVAVSLSNSGGQTEHSFDTSRCRPKHLLRSCPPKHSLNHIRSVYRCACFLNVIQIIQIILWDSPSQQHWKMKLYRDPQTKKKLQCHPDWPL